MTEEQATAAASTAGSIMDPTVLWAKSMEIWISGGWAMVAIALVALLMFGWGMHVYLKLFTKSFNRVSEDKLQDMIIRPSNRKGALGKLLNFVTAGRSTDDTALFFRELVVTEVAPFERDLRLMKMCVTAAPLLGLLGTVTGMLATFAALGAGAGGDKTMEMVASGISEALVTTMTGLVIAIPGLFFQYHLRRMLDKYKAFLAHLETLCTQKMHRDLHHTRYIQLTQFQ